MSALANELQSLGLVTPDFGNSNLSVMRGISHQMHSKGRRKKIFFLVDGLGYDLLSRSMKRDPVIGRAFSRASIGRATTLAPTFTLSVVASLNSGLDVADHGIFGDYIPIKETGRIVKTLAYMDPIDIQYAFPKPALINSIARHVPSVMLQQEHVMNTSYSQCGFNGIEMSPCASVDDLFVRLSRMVKESKYDFIYCYYSGIDHVQHMYSHAAEESTATLSGFSFAMGRSFLPALEKSDYEMIMTADHGQIKLSEKDLTFIDADSEFMSYLSMRPYGSGRHTIFSVREENEKRFEDFFSRKFGKSAILVKSDELIRSGIYGKTSVSNRFRYRLGTYVALQKGNGFFQYVVGPKKPHMQIGRHAGLSPEEMYVPIARFNG